MGIIRFCIKTRIGIIHISPGKKRIVALATIVLFSLFTLSCQTTKYVKVEPGADYENKKIVGFIKRTGEEIELSKRRPGVIHKNVIEGQEKAENKLEIRLSDVQSIEKKPETDGSFTYRITTVDGQIYLPKTVIQEGDKLIFSVFETVSVPLSDVLVLKIKEIGESGIRQAILSAPLIVVIAASIFVLVFLGLSSLAGEMF